MTSISSLLVSRNSRRFLSSVQVALGAKGKQTPKKAAVHGVPKIQRKFYSADDVASPLPSRKAAQHKTASLKAGYAAGQILILLAGRYRGKRVVLLGTTATGLLIVCGACLRQPAEDQNQRIAILALDSIPPSSLFFLFSYYVLICAVWRRWLLYLRGNLWMHG